MKIIEKNFKKVPEGLFKFFNTKAGSITQLTVAGGSAIFLLVTGVQQTIAGEPKGVFTTGAGLLAGGYALYAAKDLYDSSFKDNNGDQNPTIEIT